jgi:Transglycosylase SLT domain
MNINDFQNLDREGQFAEAGRIAGIEPSVFDGMWRTESGRGANMVSRVGAEGHFQIMPKTRATMEARFGQAIDPYNFAQGLYTAAHNMKENMGRFKNVPDALRAYNGGWTPATWGNPETAAYAGLVLGADGEDLERATGPVEAPAAPRVVRPAADLWDTPAGATPRAVAPGKPSKVASGVAALLAAVTPAPAEPNYDATNQATTNSVDRQDKAQKLRNETSFLDAARAASNGTLLNESLRLFWRDPYPIEAGFVTPELELKGKNLQEQRELRAAGSKAELERIKFDQQDTKEQNEITFRNGTAFGVAAALLADLPGAALTGGAASLAMRGVGVGAFTLAEQGRKGAAIASSLAEGVVGNVGYTAALDAMGVHQGAEQYALGVAGSVLNPVLQGRAIGRSADRAIEHEVGMNIARAAKEKQLALAVEAEKRLGAGPHTPEAIAAEMTKVEAEGLRATVASHTAAIPESRKMRAGEEPVDEVLASADKGSPEGVGNIEASAKPAPLASVDAARASDLGGNVAPRWESKDFQQRRVQAVESSPTMQAEVARMGEGSYTWDTMKELPEGIHRTAALDKMMTQAPAFRNMTHLVEELAAQYLPNSRIVLGTTLPSGASGVGANGAIVSLGRTHIIGMSPRQAFKPTGLNHTVMHELGHAVFHEKAPHAPAELMGKLHDEWLSFANDVRSGDGAKWSERYAVTSSQAEKVHPVNQYTLSFDEYMAEQFVKHVQNRAMSGAYGKLPPSVAFQIMEGLKAVIDFVKTLVGKGQLKPGAAADEFFAGVLKNNQVKRAVSEAVMPAELRAPSMDELVSMDVPGQDKLSKEILDFQSDPVARKYGLDLVPMSTPAERAEAKQILSLYKQAEAEAIANPVDEKRMNKILSRFDAFDPTSNQMLRSKNPLVRMVSAELLENGGGAAGRRSSAAVAKHMNERAIIGNVINDLDDAFKGWHRKQPGASRVEEFFTDKKLTEFNRLVAEEIEGRGKAGSVVDLGPEVRAAADAVELSFERARLMQVDAQTMGYKALPSSSRGYMPHRMRSEVVRSMTHQQQRAIHGALTDQFISGSGFDPSFADQLASKYLDRVKHKALGGFDSPVGLHQTGASDIVEEALKQMNLNQPEVVAAMKRFTAGAANHTKKRLDLDLRQTFTNDDGSTFRLIDLFDTNMLNLVRGQSQRVSGDVALARHGVMGKPGLAIIRRAMGYGEAGGMATKVEVEAFDQVAAEFLGSNFGTQNKWVDRASQANAVASLGGMGFNQLGEIINVGMTLGAKSALSIVSSTGRLRAEILTLAKGGKVNNPLLNSLEHIGGAEFGTDAYKMVFPLDMPDAPIHTMGADSIAVGDKLLRGAGHIQGSLSMWRAVNAVQVRGVAEQIVHSIAAGMRKGKTDMTLADMGISQDVLERLRADMPNIMKWEGNTLKEFDITKATDKEAANQLIQAVHRGAGQMIQQTFIGESGRYVHNSYLRMLTQFRGFGLTAIDKQWNRQKGNRGVAAALGMSVGAMSVAAPIYMVRTYLASIGRHDQQEYLERMLAPGAIARATTNYIATSGLAGDFLDAFTAVTGTGAVTGGRTGTNSQLIGNLVAPALGKADKVWGALQDTKDGTDVHGLIRELPLARLPWFIPAINALDH